MNSTTHGSGVPVSINVQAEVGAELERRTAGVPPTHGGEHV
jgi:hypothetical protein